MGPLSGPVPAHGERGGRVAEAERLRRWRLVLGGADDGTDVRLTGDDQRIDAVLGAVYDAPPAGRGGRRTGGLGSSAPGVSRWLGDIRRFFPTTVVQVVQRDAIERLRLERLLLEPEMLAAVEPDVHLVAMLLELGRLLPDTARATARQVVRRVVDQLEVRLATRVRQAVHGALDRSARTHHPRAADIDWPATIEANLHTYLPELRTIVPERLVGYGRSHRGIEREVILAIDQSGSMAESVVHAGVLASIIASVRSLRTSVVAFDTSVVDLTSALDDPVDLLFGVQLGGGTDIDAAIAYCESLVTRPADTILILVSDLYEGGVRDALVARIGRLTRQGVTCVVLLAVSDEGAPAFDREHATALAAVGAPSFACTPDAFADLLAAAIERRDLGRWASAAGFVTVSPPTP